MRVDGMPLERLVYAAQQLGSQECDACPPHETDKCWLERGLKSYTTNHADAESECTECWILWLLKGE
jgi:hypothetical protein